MAPEILLVIFVAVTAAALVLQSVTVWRTMRSAGDLVDRVSKASDSLEKDAREIMSELQKTAAGLENIQNVLDSLAARADQAGTILEQRTSDLDRLVTVLVDVGGRQAEKIDAVVSDTVAKFEQTTAIIQQDVLKPVVEISAAVKGLRTGIDFLFSKRSAQSRHRVDPEDDLFI